MSTARHRVLCLMCVIRHVGDLSTWDVAAVASYAGLTSRQAMAALTWLCNQDYAYRNPATMGYLSTERGRDWIRDLGSRPSAEGASERAFREAALSGLVERSGPAGPVTDASGIDHAAIPKREPRPYRDPEAKQLRAVTKARAAMADLARELRISEDSLAPLLHAGKIGMCSKCGRVGIIDHYGIQRGDTCRRCRRKRGKNDHQDD